VDLDPYPEFGDSMLYATTGAVQVGVAHVPGSSFLHAGVWFGTAQSFVDLHEFLPPGYGSSAATGVYEDNGLSYVAGRALNAATGASEAFVWIGVPAPGSGLALLPLVLAAGRRRRSGHSAGTL
jgi:hypothetical protein